MTLKTPIGFDDFRDVIEGQFTYVDKTLFIEEVIQTPAKVQLILRPRRFGKTLNMSMLAYFFDNRHDHSGLFEGLAIQSRPCFELCGSYPVLNLTFKDLKGGDFPTFLTLFQGMITDIWPTFETMITHLTDVEQQRFKRIFEYPPDQEILMQAISLLCRQLFKTTGRRVMLLIDEYDSPIHDAIENDYYDKAVNFMRGALSAALKGNDSVEKAILTGILRVSKESIFSGLNHVKVCTTLDKPFSTSFGFTESEAHALLTDANQMDKIDEVRHWYNGYQISDQVIYNPWSLLNYIADETAYCKPYWLNTSSNDLIRKLFYEAGQGTQGLLVQLMEGHTIKTIVQDHVSLRELDGQALWTLLLYSGYLTGDHQEQIGNQVFQYLRIPNREVLMLYEQIFMKWFEKGMGQLGMPELLQALIRGDIDHFKRQLQRLLQTIFSYYDTAGTTPERVYHAFVLGLLSHHHGTYEIRSNRESGFGRYDVMMIPKDKTQPGFVFELKTATKPETLDDTAEKALNQIQELQYHTELRAQGVQRFSEIGIAFCGKQLQVLAAQHQLS